MWETFIEKQESKNSFPLKSILLDEENGKSIGLLTQNELNVYTLERGQLRFTLS